MTNTIATKYNELRLKKERTTLLSFLKDNYGYFGSNLRILGLITDKSMAELQELFKSYDMDCELSGEILQCSFKVADSNKKIKKVEFFCNLKEDNGSLQIFTFMSSNEMYYLEKIINNSHGIHYLWISPKTLDEIKNKIIDTYSETSITHFTAKRFDNMKERCEIRPGFKRSFRYGGEDGRDTLQELRKNYGVLPRTIQFKIPTVAEFKISFKGSFTFNSGDLDYVISLFQYALEQILSTKHILESSIYKRIVEKRKYRDVQFDEIKPVSIELSSAMDAKAANELINLINNSEDFFPMNETVLEGSLYFTSTLIDKNKNESFIINSTGNEITIIKDASTSFASLLRFYQFIVERMDVDAKLRISD
jgi:hypothetical protein